MNVFQKMNAVMRELPGVKKTQQHPTKKFFFAGHEALTEAIRGLYVKHGIVRSPSVKAHAVVGTSLLLDVAVRWTNIDEPNDFHEVTILGISAGMSRDGRIEAEQAGAALSYAVKNAEMKAFALTGDDTPDAELQSREEEDDMPSDAADKAMDYLARFAEVSSAAELEALNAEVKANWGSVRGVKNFAENMTTERRKAAARLRGQG